MNTWLCSSSVGCNPLDLYSPIWNSWVGLLCIIVIMVACAFNIYSRWVDDSVADRIFYWVMLIVSVAAIMQYFTPTNPKAIYQTYLVMVALRMVSNIVERLVWHFFSGEGK